MKDVRAARVASIQRSNKRAREEYSLAGSQLATDLTHQDAAVLNVLRACESAIDLANMVIRERKLGVPKSNQDSFRLLAEAGLMTVDLAGRLQKMVGFRNVAVQRDRDLNVAVLASVITRDLDDVLRFSQPVAQLEA